MGRTQWKRMALPEVAHNVKVFNGSEQAGRYFLFFFQAEDGIRDLTVTGVQTCALPISAGLEPGRPEMPRWVPGAGNPSANARVAGSASNRSITKSSGISGCASRPPRTGEGRVGEEGRSRGAADHLKKKNESNTSVVTTD